MLIALDHIWKALRRKGNTAVATGFVRRLPLMEYSIHIDSTCVQSLAFRPHLPRRLFVLYIPKTQISTIDHFPRTPRHPISKWTARHAHTSSAATPVPLGDGRRPLRWTASRCSCTSPTLASAVRIPMTVWPRAAWATRASARSSASAVRSRLSRSGSASAAGEGCPGPLTRRPVDS